MLEWVLCLAVLTPQNAQLLIKFKDVPASIERSECEELKKDPKWAKIRYTYEKFSGNTAKVVCAGFPNTKVES